MQNVHNQKLESLKKYYKNLIIFFCFLLSFTLQTETSSAASINPCGSASNGGNCHQTINNALQSAASGSDKVVHLNDGTYWIDGHITVPSGVTLEGSRNAIVKLVNGANWAYTSAFCYASQCSSPMFVSNGSNITFKGFTIDGNCKNQGRPRGKEYYKMIAMRGSHNVTFTGMAFVDGCADGVNFRNGSGVTYANNFVDCVGHEAFYGLSSSNIKIYNNWVATCTNSAFRFDYCTGGGIEVYQNYIKSSTKASSTGPAIELAHYNNGIKIYQNQIENLRGGAAIWMNGQGSGSGVEIYNNYLRNVGQGDWSYGNAAIIVEQYKGTKIWNNYIDKGGTAAVKSGNFYSQVSGSFDINISNNTVVNTPTLVANNVSNSSRYKISTSGNCTSGISGSCPASGTAATGGVSPSPIGGGMPDDDDGGGGGGGGYTPPIDCNDRTNCNDTACKDSAICRPATPYNVKINPPPLAIITGGGRITRATNSIVNFDGTRSIDFNGTISSYAWDFNAADGLTTEASGATATHIYETPGTYVAVLTVRDNQGAVGMAKVNITIKECEGNGDIDGDGFLNVGCGGDDCDDNSSAVGNKGACLSICSGNLVLGGTCQEGTGQCNYETTVSTCENLGEACRMDACQISTDGNATCVADVSDDLCSGGLIPCGKQVDNPTTSWDESAPCDSCSMMLMGQLTIEFLVQIAAIFATLVIIIGGFLYIFAVGQSSTIDKAKSIIKYTLIGFVIIFIAWSIVNSILATVGYIDPLGGNWYTVCEN